MIYPLPTPPASHLLAHALFLCAPCPLGGQRPLFILERLGDTADQTFLPQERPLTSKEQLLLHKVGQYPSGATHQAGCMSSAAAYSPATQRPVHGLDQLPSLLRRAGIFL